MNKIKKVISSIEVFIVGMISKVYAIGTDEIISMYAVDPGPKEKIPSIVEIISKIGKIVIPVVLFVIGLIVIFNKKIAKKVKVIVVASLVILAILGVVLMNYLSTTI